MKRFRLPRFQTFAAFGATIFLSSCGGTTNTMPPGPTAESRPLAMSTASASYEVIYPFSGGLDGGNAATELVFDPQGNAYGTTVQGGNAGCGTVFRLHPTTIGHWRESVLYNFSCFSDGKNPHGGVVRDAQGNLYGTTVAGGLSGGCTGDGCGVIFKIAAGGGESVLYTFQGKNDGFGPGSPLAFDASGNLYGTAPDGGKFGDGTVFTLKSMSGVWVFEAIHQFTGGNDGSTGSLGPLFVDAHGAVFGVAELGGAHQSGVAYEMKRVNGSWTFAPIYAFKGQPDAAFPYGGLIEIGETLYGTTCFGGTTGNGSVYELTPGTTSCSERVLYSFKGGNDGSFPTSTLMAGPAGRLLYGTTSMGGGASCDCGTVFSVARGAMTESALHRFGALHDGQNPYYGLTQFGSSLYSSTVAGGTSGNGTIFSITP